MANTKSGPMFLKSIDGSREINDKDFIAKHMRDVIMEVGQNNVVQIIIDNAVVSKATSILIELKFLSIYWTPFAVHTLNLAFEKYLCNKKY